MKQRHIVIFLGIFGCLGVSIFLCGPIFLDILRSAFENPEILRPPVGQLDVTHYQDLGDKLALHDKFLMNREEGAFSTFVLDDQNLIIGKFADEFAFVDFDDFIVPQTRQGLQAYSLDPEFEFSTIAANPAFWDMEMHNGYIFAYPDTPGDKDYIVVLGPPDDRGLQIVSKVHVGRSILDLVIAGNYLYVGEFDSGLHIFDISDPTNLQLIAQHKEIDGVWYFNNLHIVDEYVYVVWGDIHVLNISDPLQPFIESTFESYYTYYPSRGRFMVSGNKAYLEEVYRHDFSRLSILDISNPSQPSYIMSYRFCLFCEGWTVIGDIFYLLFSENPYLAPRKNPEVLHLIDFTDARSPKYIGGKEMPEGGWTMTPLPQTQLLMINYRDEEYGLYLFEYVP